MNLYRRHTDKCTKKYAEYDRSGGNCNCPVWVEGQLGPSYLKQSTKTCSMKLARKLVVEAEERGSWDVLSLSTNIGHEDKQGELVSLAVAQFLADAGDRKGSNLSDPTLSKYRTILGRLLTFCEVRHLKTLDEITYEQLMAFKREWRTGPQSTANYIARLRSFWKYCLKHEWCKKNLAAELEMPRNYQFTEREPFTDRELVEILNAAKTVKLNHQQEATNEEIECIIRLMRYGGLAISDAALFCEGELRGDEARYYRKKTSRSANRQLVVVPLPTSLCERIRRLPLHSGKYYFCHGDDSVGAATDVWHKRIGFVFEAAGIKDGSAHRFRHSFATSLLVAGKPVELVSRWLGHNDLKITIKYYSHWIEQRIKAASDVLRDHYANS